jgi:hypothetical protein
MIIFREKKNIFTRCTCEAEVIELFDLVDYVLSSPLENEGVLWRSR